MGACLDCRERYELNPMEINAVPREKGSSFKEIRILSFESGDLEGKEHLDSTPSLNCSSPRDIEAAFLWYSPRFRANLSKGNQNKILGLPEVNHKE